MYRRNSFLRRYFTQLPIGLLLVLLLFAGALILFGYVSHEVLAENEKQFDEAVFSYLSAHIINPGLTRFMKLVTWFASARFLQISYGVLLVSYLVAKKFKRTAEIAAIGLGGFLVNYFMKLFFHRLRPLHPLIAPLKNFSFPSGHATSGFIFYGLLSYLLWKTKIPKPLKFAAISLLVLFSLLIGFSRIYLRLHYTSDVIAGFCIGFAWLLLTIYLFEYLTKKAIPPHRDGK
jgi:membrane-associated phospholipid phosphatase